MPRASPWRRCARWNSSRWCNPEVSGDSWLGWMLDLLKTTTRTIFFDETSRQLVADKRPAIGASRGLNDMTTSTSGTAPETCSCSRTGWRHGRAAHFGLRSSDEVATRHSHRDDTAGAGNLNTHKLGSLYDAFKPAEARRIAKRLVHYTPVHRRWLKIELSVFSNQCQPSNQAKVVLKREVRPGTCLPPS